MSNDQSTSGDKPGMTQYVSQDTPPCKGWGLLLSHRFVYAEQVDSFVCKSCGWVPGFVPVDPIPQAKGTITKQGTDEHSVPTMEVEVPPDTKPICGDVHPEVSTITCTKFGPHSGVHSDGYIHWYNGKPLVQLKVLLDTETARLLMDTAEGKGMTAGPATGQAIRLWAWAEEARRKKGQRVGTLRRKKISGYEFSEWMWD